MNSRKIYVDLTVHYASISSYVGRGVESILQFVYSYYLFYNCQFKSIPYF